MHCINMVLYAQNEEKKYLLWRAATMMMSSQKYVDTMHKKKREKEVENKR